jgi:hypothetical protein
MSLLNDFSYCLRYLVCGVGLILIIYLYYVYIVVVLKGFPWLGGGGAFFR